MVDKVPLPTSKKGNSKAKEMATFMQNIQAKSSSKIEKSNAKYKAAFDAHKREVLFKEGDFVWYGLS